MKIKINECLCTHYDCICTSNNNWLIVIANALDIKSKQPCNYWPFTFEIAALNSSWLLILLLKILPCAKRKEVVQRLKNWFHRNFNANDPIFRLFNQFSIRFIFIATDFVLVAVILLSHRFHMNPDNLATPLAASIGDVVSLSVLSFIASKLFEYIGE